MDEPHGSSLDFMGPMGLLDPDTLVNHVDTSESYASHARIQNNPEAFLESFSLSISPDITGTKYPRTHGCNKGSLGFQESFSESADQSNQSEFNFSEYLADFSRRGSPSSQTSNPADFALQHIDDDYQTFNGDGIGLLSVCGDTESHIYAEEHRSHPPQPFQCIETIGQNGISLCDPNAIVGPLDFMNSHLLDSLNYPLLDWYTFNGSTLSDLLALLHSETLLLGVEKLLGEAMEARAKAIRQRQAARQEVGGSHASDATVNKSMLSEAEIVSGKHREVWKQLEYASRTKDSSYLHSVTSGWALRAEYVPLVNDNINRGAQGPTGLLKLFSSPRTRQRTTGVLVTFIPYKEDSPVPCLSPYIQTFNVVHQDSEIIQKVSCGDVQGVRRLFDAKLASPLDVDPYGFSLLSV